VGDRLEGWFQDAPDRVGRARLLAEVEHGLFGGRRDATHVGRYRIERRLGGGGQGVVYVARDPALDRRVAVKLMHVDTRGDPFAYARLLREASALAQLAHPNVVAVNDVGTCEAGIYLVTELVEGQTLAQWLEGATRSRDAIVDVFAQAGAGLAAAHARGIVHRDFKPANVLVAADGRVRLLDFGLARGHDTDDDLPPSPPSRRRSTPVRRRS
jgi:serine/threonine protein kinase